MILFPFLKISVRFYTSLPSNIRVRFAPSPTGFLHLGGLRTAFYNFLYARKYKGKFILRIEDTDQKRIKLGSYENFLSVLKWTSLEPDESPEVGGPYGPYVQSERLPLYQEKANHLIETGAAYRCFCSELRLSLLRKEASLKRLNQGYDNKCRHLTSTEIQKLMDEGRPFTIRFKIPDVTVNHHDIVYGESSHNLSETEGDFVILKSDGFPTYHFSCVVDDHFMDISHVLRGAEWLVSTPKHILLHESFGWQPPKFAHLPLLINSDRTKLSKRQESIGVEYFKAKGYAPEALLNFLAVTGGGFGKQEGCFVDSLETLCSKFHLENLNTSSCILDLRKLDLFNHDYLLQQFSKEDTTKKMIQNLRSILQEKYGKRYDLEERNLTDSYIEKILLAYKERLNKLLDIVDKETEYLWTAVDTEDVIMKLKELKIPDTIVEGLKSVVDMLSSLPESDLTQQCLVPLFKTASKQGNLAYKDFMMSLRVVLTGQKDGPGVVEIVTMLGKERSIGKLKASLEKIDELRNSNEKVSLS